MTTNPDDHDGDPPIAYLERIRDWYLALGYGAPYRWAHFDDVPFTPLGKPLGDCSIGLVTTAAPYQPGRGDQGPGAAYNGAAKFFSVFSGDTADDPDLRISHIGIDRAHTTAEDQRSHFPLDALRALAERGMIGALGPRFHGLPTDRSQRTTMEVHCAEIVARCKADGVDAVVLAANCPVCHQSVSLAARALEEAGIATVVMGCAKDLVEHIGVPRFLFSDFPLGNAAGRPNDPASQLETAEMAVRLLADARGPRTTIRSPLKWNGVADWKLDYCNAERLSPEELAERRRDFDRGKSEAKQARRTG
jgi:glycine/betaine/sarcosine/D-proline reductase family selenoprotein B